MIYFELLTAFFWALTYILIVISGHLSKDTRQVAMPYMAGVLNIAWEICAMIETQGGWIFVLWFAIDLLIVYYGFRYLDTARNKALYIFSIIMSMVVFHWSFQFRYGYMYSVYLIDLLMEIDYFMQRRALSPKLKTSIAVTKLLGDFFAGFVFGQRYASIAVISALVLLLNTVYLILCIGDRRHSAKAITPSV